MPRSRHPGLVNLPDSRRLRRPARGIRLRGRAWHRAAESMELWTLTEQAHALGVSHASISRVLTGRDGPGTRFIAGSLAAFPHMSFDDLFEIVLAVPRRIADADVVEQNVTCEEDEDFDDDDRGDPDELDSGEAADDDNVDDADESSERSA